MFQSFACEHNTFPEFYLNENDVNWRNKFFGDQDNATIIEVGTAKSFLGEKKIILTRIQIPQDKLIPHNCVVLSAELYDYDICHQNIYDVKYDVWKANDTTIMIDKCPIGIITNEQIIYTDKKTFCKCVESSLNIQNFLLNISSRNNLLEYEMIYLFYIKEFSFWTCIISWLILCFQVQVFKKTELNGGQKKRNRSRNFLFFYRKN